MRIGRSPFIERGKDKTAAYFHGANRGKTSLAIDLKDAGDLVPLKSMIAGVDILIENFKVRGSDKVWSRFGQIARRALRPRLLLSYRLRTRRALCLPLGLWFSYARHVRHDEPDRRAKEATAKKCRRICGYFLGPLRRYRQSGGIGRADTLWSGPTCGYLIARFNDGGFGQSGDELFISGKAPTRLANAHPNMVPYKVFTIADGHAIIACGNDR